jgi:proteasome lid subunit RPN8/RPN11
MEALMFEIVYTEHDDGSRTESADPVARKANWDLIRMHIQGMSELYGRSHECVGVFARNGDRQFTEYLVNESEARGHFTLSDDDAMTIYQYIEDGLLLGVWHTHPNGKVVPSQEDWTGHPRGVPMYIIAVNPGYRLTVTRHDEDDRPGKVVEPE